MSKAGVWRCAARSSAVALVLACGLVSCSIQNGNHNKICDKSTCGPDVPESGYIEISHVYLNKTKEVAEDIYDVEGVKVATKKFKTNLISVEMLNRASMAAVVNRVMIHVDDVIRLNSCPGGGGGGYSTTHYSIIIPEDQKVPGLIEADLKGDAFFSEVAAGDADGLDISIGYKGSRSGVFPLIYKLRVSLIGDGDEEVTSSPIVIATPENLIDIAIGLEGSAQSGELEASGYGDSNRMLKCFKDEAEAMRKFTEGVPYIAPGVSKMIKVFGSATPLSVD